MNLIHGDCLVELKKIKDKSIDFVYLDLPFGQTGCKWDVKIDHHALWIELKRIANSDRTPFFFSCTTKFGFELFNSAPKGYFRWDLVWEKNRAAGFLNAYRLPMRKHEMIYCFAKKTPGYNISDHFTNSPLPTSILDINGSSEIYNINKTGKRNQGKKDQPRLPTSVLDSSEYPVLDIPSSWCKFKNDEKVNHRTAKPVKLMEFLLKYWSKEGDTILDPTAGSGSMGIACLNMNRKFIGIEKDDDIFQIMKDRIENHQPQKQPHK
jgi:site-specific DNA-methyltransferase (adenine-specific)